MVKKTRRKKQQRRRSDYGIDKTVDTLGKLVIVGAVAGMLPKGK